jgi:1-deoxy-D-xylulose-5-phosphate reductoisomerase
MAAPAPRLDLAAIGTLTFEEPDDQKFPALRLAREALRRGGAAPIVLNAANEVAVGSFLAGQIGFLDIPRLVEETLQETPSGSVGSIADVIVIDLEARERARRIVQGFDFDRCDA